MTPGRLDITTVRRLLLALDEALQVLYGHQGRSVEEGGAGFRHGAR